MKNFWIQLSCTKQIASVVFVLHFSFVAFFCISHLATSKSHKHRIAVRTLPARTTTISTESSVKPVASTSKIVSTPLKKEVPLKKTAGTSLKKQVPAKTPYQESLLKEIEEQVSSLTNESSFSLQPKVDVSLPKMIASVQMEEVPLNRLDYAEELIAYLQSTLELPERGDVKMELEMDAKGHLVYCEVLTARSKKNGEFLKNRLPTLVFPCFNGAEKNDATFTFIITFKGSSVF